MELSVSALIGKLLQGLGDLTLPLRSWLAGIGWALGDWTFFMPIALPVIFWAFFKITRRPTRGRHYLRIAVLGLVLGGVIEHFQPAAEVWLIQQFG